MRQPEIEDKNPFVLEMAYFQQGCILNARSFQKYWTVLRMKRLGFRAINTATNASLHHGMEVE